MKCKTKTLDALFALLAQVLSEEGLKELWLEGFRSDVVIEKNLMEYLLRNTDKLEKLTFTNMKNVNNEAYESLLDTAVFAIKKSSMVLKELTMS